VKFRNGNTFQHKDYFKMWKINNHTWKEELNGRGRLLMSLAGRASHLSQTPSWLSDLCTSVLHFFRLDVV
jgi:hypothetical protein